MTEKYSTAMCHSRVHLLVLKLGSKVIERGALDLVSILWRHRDWFWSWCGERVSRVRVCGFCKGGAGERRWSADHSADQSSSSCPVLPSCLVVSGALLMAGSLPAIGQDARRGRNLIGPTAQSLLTAGCPAFRAAHTLQIHLESRPTANFCF